MTLVYLYMVCGMSQRKLLRRIGCIGAVNSFAYLKIQCIQMSHCHLPYIDRKYFQSSNRFLILILFHTHLSVSFLSSMFTRDISDRSRLSVVYYPLHRIRILYMGLGTAGYSRIGCVQSVYTRAPRMCVYIYIFRCRRRWRCCCCCCYAMTRITIRDELVYKQIHTPTKRRKNIEYFHRWQSWNSFRATVPVPKRNWIEGYTTQFIRRRRWQQKNGNWTEVRRRRDEEVVWQRNWNGDNLPRHMSQMTAAVGCLIGNWIPTQKCKRRRPKIQTKCLVLLSLCMSGSVSISGEK